MKVTRMSYSGGPLAMRRVRSLRTLVLLLFGLQCTIRNSMVEGFQRSNLGRRAGSLTSLQLSNAVAEKDDVWTSRRKIIRSTLKPLAKEKMQKRLQDIIDGVDQVTDEDSKEKRPSGLLVTAFLVATSALVLRVGGRSAFVSVLGLDFVADSGIKSQVNDFVNNFQSMGAAERYGSFFLAWLAAKAFCLDAFTIVLAFSSGILFGGILEGTDTVASCFRNCHQREPFQARAHFSILRNDCH
jgi:hypothetical protein